MTGICDKVAIVGMGCSRFGERWDCDAEDLMLEAFREASADAGVEAGDLDAAWFGCYFDDASVGKSALPLANALRLKNIPVTRVENMCATGTEALRGAVYAVAAGACDIALALGVEKLKDTGYGGLPVGTPGTFTEQWRPNTSSPGSFAQLASAYRAEHRVKGEDLKRAMAHVSWKSHLNGAINPKAHLRRAVDLDTIIGAPMVAEPLGLFDCCGVSDGAACAIVARPEIARELGKTEIVTVKALQLAVSNGSEAGHEGWNGSYIHCGRLAGQRALEEAGVRSAPDEIDLMEVHDCFSITELVTMEDLGFAEEGQGWRAVLDGAFDRDGATPCQIDGGLKCFGHPIGASGLRMAYEVYLQLLGRAGDRQLPSPTLGLTHNLGGEPARCVVSVAVFGRND